MEKIKIKVTKEKIHWESLVGAENFNNGYKVICWKYDEENKKASITERHGDTDHVNEVILEDVHRATSQLNLLGFEIEFEESFTFSQETKRKAQGLIVAGYSKLIMQEDNYVVDNEFSQKLLTQEELNYLLKKKLKEIELAEIC